MSDNKQDILDQVLQEEGEAFLAAVAEKKGINEKSVLNTAGEAVTTAHVDVKQPSFEEVAELARAQAIQERTSNVKKMLEIVKGSKRLQDVRDVMFACYQLIFWGRMEMSAHEDVLDSMITDFDRHIEESVYKNSEGYDLERAVKQMKFGALPIMNNIVAEYKDIYKARGASLNRIKKLIGDKGIALPDGLKELFGRPLTPGAVFVVAGEQKDTSLLLKEIQKAHKTVNGCESNYFSLGESDIPVTRWSNCAANRGTLKDAFNPYINDKTVLLLIEDVEELFKRSETKLDVYSRKAYALNRLLQFAIDNLVAVVVADNVSASDYDKRFYGALPTVFVRTRETKLGPDIFVNDLLLKRAEDK